MPLVSSEANLAFSPISSSLTTIAYDGTRYANYEGTISEIDFELSITIGNGVFLISFIFRLIIGFINNKNIEKTLINRKKAKNQYNFD